jgi:FkbM family methyltransferase
MLQLPISRILAKFATRVAAMTNPFSSFSSHGEDQIIRAILERLVIENTTYLEIGAYHPEIASNTALLSRMGWSGCLVEPNPFMANLLREMRPKDLVLEVACGQKRSGELLLFSDWGSSNTLDTNFAKSITEGQGVPVSKTIQIDVVPANEILERMNSKGYRLPTIVSIDVEGMDLEVLSTFDFISWKPTIILIEDIELELSDPSNSPIFTLLTKEGYRLFSHAIISSVYILDLPSNRLF